MVFTMCRGLPKKLDLLWSSFRRERKVQTGKEGEERNQRADPSERKENIQEKETPFWSGGAGKEVAREDPRRDEPYFEESARERTSCRETLEGKGRQNFVGRSVVLEESRKDKKVESASSLPRTVKKRTVNTQGVVEIPSFRQRAGR